MSNLLAGDTVAHGRASQERMAFYRMRCCFWVKVSVSRDFLPLSFIIRTYRGLL